MKSIKLSPAQEKKLSDTIADISLKFKLDIWADSISEKFNLNFYAVPYSSENITHRIWSDGTSLDDLKNVLAEFPHNGENWHWIDYPKGEIGFENHSPYHVYVKNDYPKGSAIHISWRSGDCEVTLHMPTEIYDGKQKSMGLSSTEIDVYMSNFGSREAARRAGKNKYTIGAFQCQEYYGVSFKYYCNSEDSEKFENFILTGKL